MRVRFWGVRGSVPFATPGSIGYGCNTPCVEIVDEPSGRRLILDAGSGIVGVGSTLRDAAERIPVVLTHYHWDHVQGLPFFAPLYRPGTSVAIWAPTLGRRFADIETMFGAPFFPVPYDRLPSRPEILMHARRPRRDQRVHLDRTASESSGRGVRVSNRAALMAISCMRRITSSAMPDMDSALAHFSRGARAHRSSTPISRRKKCTAQRMGAQRLVAMRAVRGALRRQRTVAFSSQAGPDRRRDEANRERGAGTLQGIARRKRGYEFEV